MLYALAAFLVLVLALLALDLGVLQKKPHAPSLREALATSALWLGIGVAFAGVVYFAYAHHALGLGLEVPQLGGHAARTVSGAEAAGLYLTGYALEKALAVDNLFVMLFVMRGLSVPSAQQHRVLFWGILGALVLRGVMIAVGATVVHHFEWVLVVFGAVLLVSGIKLAREKKDEPRELPKTIGWIERFVPVARGHEGDWLVRTSTGWAITTSLLALLTIELADVVFAIDSIPAVFAVTLDPFIVFTSNILAILGLRSLYFVLAIAADRLPHLGKALAFILVFVGAKMIALHWDVHVPAMVSLSVIVGALGIGVGASLVTTRRERAAVTERV